MGPPSQLAIATSALNRLVKEEKSYHTEFDKQLASIAKLEQGGGGDDENAEFTLRQEVCLIFDVHFRLLSNISTTYVVTTVHCARLII